MTPRAYTDFTTLKIYKNLGEDDIEIANDGGYKITMPDSDVTINATFKVADGMVAVSDTAFLQSNQEADQTRTFINSYNGVNAKALMKFDLTGIDTSRIYSAKLKVYNPVTDASAQKRTLDYTIGFVDTIGDWNGKTATYATTTVPAMTATTVLPSSLGAQSVTFAHDQWAIHDITNTIYNATAGVHSLAVSSSGAASLYFGGVKSEYVPKIVYTLGKFVTYKYNDSNSDPVEGIAVTLSDGQTGTTDNSGEVTFLVAGNGTYTATTANTSQYKASSVQVTIDGADAVADTETLEANSTKDVTFTASNDASATVAVYTDEEKATTPLTAKEGTTYTLTQGVTYYYTFTPSDATANDAKEGSVTVAADTTNVTVTLDEKTYTVTFTNVPQYAKVTLNDSAAVYSDVNGKNAGEAFELTKVSGGTTISYKIEKGGYTTLDTTKNITADTTIDIATELVPTVANTLYYEDFETTGKKDDASGVFGSTGDVITYLKNRKGNHTMQTSNSKSGSRTGTLTLANSIQGYNTYTLSYTLSNFSCGSNASGTNENYSSYFELLDSDSKVMIGVGPNYLHVDSKTNTFKGFSTILGTANTNTENAATTLYVKAEIDTKTPKVTLTVASDADYTTKIIDNKVYNYPESYTVSNVIKGFSLVNTRSTNFDVDNILIVGSNPVE